MARDVNTAAGCIGDTMFEGVWKVAGGGSRAEAQVQVKIIAEASDRCIEERMSHHRAYRDDAVASEG